MTQVGPLSFYDHARQTYAHLPIRDGAIAEFMVGDYGAPNEDQGVGEGGEFAIFLYRFGNRFGPPKPLSAQLRVFGDAYGSLRKFIDMGALDLLEKSEIRSNDDLTAVLIGAGLRDRSDFAERPRACQHCMGSGIDYPQVNR